ncbi:MAG: hypothetical protein IJ220_05355 [Clostridia bacterium]|nr:hypothetical protein [Clostridia bacterium]
MNQTKLIQINHLPENVEELKAMLGEYTSSPFKMAALSVAVFCHWEKNATETIEMLNLIKGPNPISPMDQQFIRDRLGGKGYVVRSYFKGTSPENDYTLTATPYVVEVSDNPYSYQNENYATLYLTSSGADSPRPITLRLKPSTGEWFLWEHTFLADIRVPKSMDGWA